MRLIDADKLKEELSKHIDIWCFNASFDGILAKIIDNAPTVEIRDNFDVGYALGYKDGMTGADMRGEEE